MVLLETLCGFGIFGAVNIDKIIKVALGFVFFRGLPDLMQFGFGRCLQALWQLIEHVGGLVNPAALPAGVAVYLGQRFPEAQGAVSHGQLRTNLKTATFETQQQLGPGQFAFAESTLDGNQLLGTVFGGADDHQQALLIVHAHVAVDAIGPKITYRFADSSRACH